MHWVTGRQVTRTGRRAADARHNSETASERSAPFPKCDANPRLRSPPACGTSCTSAPCRRRRAGSWRIGEHGRQSVPPLHRAGGVPFPKGPRPPAPTRHDTPSPDRAGRRSRRRGHWRELGQHRSAWRNPNPFRELYYCRIETNGMVQNRVTIMCVCGVSVHCGLVAQFLRRKGLSIQWLRKGTTTIPTRPSGPVRCVVAWHPQPLVFEPCRIVGHGSILVISG